MAVTKETWRVIGLLGLIKRTVELMDRETMRRLSSDHVWVGMYNRYVLRQDGGSKPPH